MTVALTGVSDQNRTIGRKDGVHMIHNEAVYMKKNPSIIALIAVVLVLSAAQTVEAGKLRRLIYLNYPGSTITNLYAPNNNGVQTFPTIPDERDFLPSGEPGAVYAPYVAATAIDFRETYGSLIQGYLTAPETGNYTFWLASDDEGEFYMTTDPLDPLNPAKTNRLCWVPGYSGSRQWDKFPEQQSASVSLEAGKTYYIEIRHKEGTSGDHIALGWQTPSGALERPMPSWHLQPIKYSNPLFLPEPDVEVVTGPVSPKAAGDFYVFDGNLAVIFANINLDQPVTYQWLRGGLEVPGATNAYYIFRANMADNDSVWTVRVTSGGTTYVGGPTTLLVANDKPTVLSAGVALQNPTLVQVVFSEDVDVTTATNLANYTLPGATLLGATLAADNRTVSLRTSLLTPTQVYTLTVNNVRDMAVPPNTMDAYSTNFVIADGAVSFRSWGFYRPDGLDELRRWSYQYSTAPAYVNDMYVGLTNITTTSYAWNLTPLRDHFNGQLIGYLTPPETGMYKFAIASDDHSILYLGTSEQRSSKRAICYYNGSTGRWNTGAQVANQQSALIYLEAGKSYYIEAIHRDGTGGDGVSVFWQTPSGAPLPTINQNVQSTTERFLIPAQYLSTYATPPVSGAISYRFWDAAPNDLATLRSWSTNGTTAPSYINDMFVDERIITTNSYQWNLTPLADRYMAHIIGYVTAPEPGNYRFGIACDDHAVLYLGTSEDRSTKREICNYNGSSGRWQLGASSSQLSANIALEAGKRYYIEAAYRDGTGGDGVTIAWYTPSMLAATWAWPPANNEPATRPYIIPAAYMSTFNTFGNVFLKTDLAATLNAVESTQPTLRVVPDGSQPYSYQWYRNGVAVPGATAAGYTLPSIQQADHGAGFSVVVSNHFSSVTSVVATLSVTAENNKPSVASVGSFFRQIVEVRLSEGVTKGSAEDEGNYQLRTSLGASVTVDAAVQDLNDPAHVTLQTAAMPETDLMQLIVQNLVDLSAAANTMDPQTNVFRANNFESLTRIGNTQPFAATAAGSQVSMTAGGSDIWGAADQFVFAHKKVTNNFDYKVQGLALPPVNQWCKMGIMARSTTDANARNAFVAFTPFSPAQNTYTPQVRDVTGGSSTSTADAGSPLALGLQPGVPAARPTVVYPSWVRLQRIGNVFYYYYSTDGANWTWWTVYDSSTSLEGALPATLEVGLALTSHDTARTVDGLMNSFSAVTDGSLFLALQPTNTTVAEGGTATFYAAAGGSTPYFYQWRLNNTDIFGATNATLSLARVSFCTDNNAQIACRISNGYGQSLTSTNATLTVIQDTVPPTMAFYVTPKINLAATEVKLLFSEWVDTISSQEPNNYKIYTVPANTPLNVYGALREADERTVTLTTDPQTPGMTYRVVVNNVKDLACNANTIAVNSTDYFFFAGTAANYAQRADGYIIMEAENAQENVAASDGDAWVPTNSPAGASGVGAMFVPDDRGDGGTAGTSPDLYGTGAKLVYHINFNRTGRHIIWIRAGLEQNTEDAGNKDSIFVGFNTTAQISDPSADYCIARTSNNQESAISGFSGAGTGWLWRSDRMAGADPFAFTNTTTGLHRLMFWHREDGAVLDKIVIEAGDRAASTTAAPAPCTANNNLGEPETWDYVVAPPGGPTVSINSPTNRQVFTAGNLSVTAVVTGPSPIVLVEFFQGTNLIGTATSSPYTVTWQNVTEGIYSLTARVTDVLGYQATSAAVQIVEANALTLSDVTQPGDPISLLNGSSPAAETVTNMINNTTSKCLNYDALDLGAPFVGPVGFIVTPSAGRSVVSKLRFYTANDAQERDPVNFVLDGSNDGSTWSLITSNLLTLPVGRNAAGQPLDLFAQNVWHVPFANTTEYASYRLRFFNVKNELAANSMQLGEVEFLGTVVQPPSLSITPGTAGSLVITVSQPGTLHSTTNLAAPTWVDEGPVSGTKVITPAPDVPQKFYRLSVP